MRRSVDFAFYGVVVFLLGICAETLLGVWAGESDIVAAVYAGAGGLHGSTTVDFSVNFIVVTVSASRAIAILETWGPLIFGALAVASAILSFVSREDRHGAVTARDE